MNSKLKLLALGLAWLGFAASGSALRAADKIDFQGLAEFRSLILTNEALALSGVDVVTLTNGKAYLVSLGTTANPARQDPEVQAKLDTRKVAEAKARKAAAEFLDVEVSTEEKLTAMRKTETVSTHGASKSQTTKLIKVREEIITQKSRVVFSGSRTVATWSGDGGESFVAVVAFELSDNKSK